MKYTVKPYAVISTADWTIDSLAHDLNQPHAGTKLSDVADLNLNRLDVTSLNDDTSYPYIEAASLSAETGIIVDTKIAAKSELPTRAKFIARAGDVLMTTVRPERGLVAIVPEELDGCIVSSSLVVLSPTQWNSELIYFLLRSEKCRNELSLLARGRAVPTLTLKHVTNYVLPINKVTPELLDDAAELYRAWSSKVQGQRTLTEIVEGIFQQILLNRDHQPQREIPKHKVIPYESLVDRLDVPYHLSMEKQTAEWSVPVVKLSDIIIATRAGQSVSPGKYSDNGKPFIRIQDLDNDAVYLGPRETVMVPDSDYGKAELTVGDLLVARVGSVGKTNVVSEVMLGAIASQHLLIIKVTPDAMPEYVTLFLKSKWGKSQFDAVSVGVAQPFIQQSALEQIILPLPTIEQQEAIVSRVTRELRQEDTSRLEKEVEAFYCALLNDCVLR